MDTNEREAMPDPDYSGGVPALPRDFELERVEPEPSTGGARGEIERIMQDGDLSWAACEAIRSLLGELDAAKARLATLDSLVNAMREADVEIIQTEPSETHWLAAHRDAQRMARVEALKADLERERARSERMREVVGKALPVLRGAQGNYDCEALKSLDDLIGECAALERERKAHAGWEDRALRAEARAEQTEAALHQAKVARESLEEQDGAVWGWVGVPEEDDLPSMSSGMLIAIRAEQLRELLERERARSERLDRYLYNAGYMAGHEATVEGRFTDIVTADMYDYHEEEAAELRAALSGEEAGNG